MVQGYLTPFWRATVGCGCELDRDTVAAIKSVFSQVDYKEEDVCEMIPFMVRFQAFGVATKKSDNPDLPRGSV